MIASAATAVKAIPDTNTRYKKFVCNLNIYNFHDRTVAIATAIRQRILYNKNIKGMEGTHYDT